jgi:hypothetical protein
MSKQALIDVFTEALSGSDVQIRESTRVDGVAGDKERDKVAYRLLEPEQCAYEAELEEASSPAPASTWSVTSASGSSGSKNRFPLEMTRSCD